MSKSKSILSFFGRSQSSASSSTSSVNNVDMDKDKMITNDVAKESSSNSVEQYHPPENFQFPKIKIGNRERHCQYQWFNNFNWLHYDAKKDSVFCYYCMIHKEKLTAEHNKEQAYISEGFRNWKKAPACFKDHEQTKCHKAALTYQVIVPRCGDAAELNNNELTKQRYNERQYLKIVMECLQYLARQGIALRGNEDGNDNLTQLLLLRGKDHPLILERLKGKVSGKRSYTHHDFQNELLSIMANNVLRSKLNEVKVNKCYSIMCDEYTDMSNKEQLSFCIRWIDSMLNAREDFMGYYEIPDIKSDTIVMAIKDALIRMNLPFCDLRGQTYDGASNMLGHRSGVAKQIADVQPKALATHCHGHSLSLSVKDVTKQCKLLDDVMGTVAEITILVKYSPKREKLLGSIQQNLEYEDEYDYEKTTNLSKLCVTRWTVRASTYMKVLSNYDQLMTLWNVCLQGSLDKEVRSRIIGCESQMKKFNFFFDLHLGHRLYSITDNLSKTLQSEKMPAIEGQRISRLTIKTFESMRTDEAAKMFYDSVIKKASKHTFIEAPVLSRKRKRPNYRALINYFHVDGHDYGGEAHNPVSVEYEYRAVYFEALDIITAAIKTRFEQPSFKAFLKLESFLLTSIKGDIVDEEDLNFISETYSNDLHLPTLEVETSVLKPILEDVEVSCFNDIYKNVKEISQTEKKIILNVIAVCKLLIINPATSCTLERSFSSARRLKTWLRSTMNSKRFNSLAILSIHKELTDAIDLVAVGNEFASIHDRSQYTLESL